MSRLTLDDENPLTNVGWSMFPYFALWKSFPTQWPAVKQRSPKKPLQTFENKVKKRHLTLRFNPETIFQNPPFTPLFPKHIFQNLPLFLHPKPIRKPTFLTPLNGLPLRSDLVVVEVAPEHGRHGAGIAGARLLLLRLGMRSTEISFSKTFL